MALRKVLLVAALAVALLVVADTAVAGPLTISTTTNRLGNGGEFRISGISTYYIPPAAAVTSVDGGDFNSFCIEWNEHINLPGSYDYSTDAGAIAGGVSGGNPDPVSAETAKLFYMFWFDKWSVSTAANLQTITYSYANGAQRGIDGQDLQYALWFLEGERTQTELTAHVTANAGSQAQLMVNLANDADLTWNALGEDWTGVGGVRALNLYDPVTGGNRQSQLIFVPLPPGALMGFALLAGLGIVTLVRRRRMGVAS